MVPLIFSRDMKGWHKCFIYYEFFPGPPSIVRQLAYQAHSPLVGPDGDPDGWHTLAPVKIQGIVFSSRSVEVMYTVST